MSPYSKTFDQWREYYFTIPDDDEHEEARSEALEGMVSNATIRSEFAETWRIAVNVEQYSSAHPLCLILTNGSCFAPETKRVAGNLFSKVRQFSSRFRRAELN